MLPSARSLPTPDALPPLRSEALHAQVLKLCRIGNRFVGSKGEREARGLVEEEFRRAGLRNVRLEHLVTVGYRPKRASCELLGSSVDLPATGLQFSGSETVKAQAVFIGSPRSLEDLDRLEKVGVRGKIVLLQTPVPFVFASELAERGAVGLIVISGNAERQIGHFIARGYPAPDGPLQIPGVTIDSLAGSRLVALIGTRKRALRLEHRAEYVPTRTANVVGEIPGVEIEAQEVVIGAHYDTQLEGVGACDNATGVAALLEIARTWVSLGPRRTVVLVAFADEEHGCFGSVEYCRRHSGQLDATVGMVNLDALGWVYPAKKALHADPSIHGFALECAQAMGWVPEDEPEASLLAGSDHNAFIDAGVPACWFWRYPPPHPYYHSEGDDPALLDFHLIAETANVAAYTALCLAQVSELELGRSTPTKRWIDLRPEAMMP